jgi:hypothetical protein
MNMGVIHGRGWVRTSDLSRVKSDKAADKPRKKSEKPSDLGEGG